MNILALGLAGLAFGAPVSAADADPFSDLDHPKPPPKDNDPFADLDHPKTASKDNDPFSDLDGKSPKPVTPASATASKTARPVEDTKSWGYNLFHENFTFKKELDSQFTYSAHDNFEDRDGFEKIYSRQSVGFEVLKKFSTKSATVASVDIQGRLVRRDNFIETPSDTEGDERKGWFFEIHNAYADFYNIFNPVLDSETQGKELGRFNMRVGRFYIPFGLNTQTDTHGTLLQLSNDRNFGFERDWYAGMWGSLNKYLNYDVYYALGSNYDISFKGQKGLAGGRVSLADHFLTEYGLQAGTSFIYGERIDPSAIQRSVSVERASEGQEIVDTMRGGFDVRYRHIVPGGSLTYTTEWSFGKDENDEVATQLQQLDFLARNRSWGLSTQYRRFYQNMKLNTPSDAFTHPPATHKADASIFGEFTWYFRNDIGNSNLHWLKLNVEREVEWHEKRPLDTKITLQYYRYW